MTPLLALVVLALGEDPVGGTVTWSEHVRPILAEHCFECHGPDPETRAAGVRLDTAEGLAPMVEGGLDAELLFRVTSEDDFDRMPPPDHSGALGADDVATLRSWLEDGAPWEAHWAYAPFRDVEPPAVEGGWPRSPLDAFVLARLKAEGLEPAPEADRATLLRRVHLDLTGLPPTDEELEAFLTDDRVDAYERVVDGLLDSVHFAERWARHWLDVARYADSHGFTIDGGRSIWPWRDWVVDSIHRDQPFDEFTIEQLAGDLLPNASRDQRIATGFHRNTQINQEGGADDEENRVNAVMDRVVTTGAAWLGATMSCAQCHTHKFDPITHEEYYRLYAFFDQTRDTGVGGGPSLLVPRNAEEADKIERWEARRVELSAGLSGAREKAAEGWTTWQPPRAWASNGTKLRPEENGSFSAVGQGSIYSTYVLEGGVLEGAAASERIAALRLEALPMGGRGPGRSGSGNFVLQELRLFTRKKSDGDWRPVRLAEARASFEQDTSAEGGGAYPIAAAIDGEVDSSGWAIKPAFGQPHVAVFRLAKALAPSASREFRVELVQEHGNRHTLASFRLAVGPRAAWRSDVLVTDDWRSAVNDLRDHGKSRPGAPTTLVLEAREVPRTTRVFHRGSFLDPRDEVTPGFPEALDHFSARDSDGAAPLTRLDLARWLVHSENALVHRVTVNRWWQHLFGRGLVATENDFGLRGERPSHPELLEWLAREFVAGGQSRKALLRTIVTSATYRQAARHDAALLERDPQNELLARQRRLRLEGEALRDAMLVASGVLDRQVGGPPVQPPQPEGVFAFTQNRKNWKTSEGTARFRRSLYTRIWRTAPFPFYATFDAPAANATCTRRARSTSPLQALALANDPLVVDLTEAFAQRVLALEGADDAARIERAFAWCVARPPLAPERERLLEHLRVVREARDETAAWRSVARVLFNLDEFQNRP